MSPIPPSEINVLVVDDENTLRSTCRAFLEGFGYNVVAVERADEAVALLKRRSFQILLLDLYMPQMSGLDLLKVALELHPRAKVIMMTGNPSVETSDAALQAGAFDYIPKPFSATHLEIMVDRALHALSEEDQPVGPSSAASEAAGPRGRRKAGPPAANGAMAQVGEVAILGESKVFRNVVELARRVASTDASVFITGESGTGKELIAQFIHHHSPRREKPLVEVNCAAIPESLFESEMFGHVEGAFTGAIRSREGLLEAASHGTLFLDELVEMPLAIQAKLLRVLQDGVLRRVGSSKTDTVTVRFVAATNRNPLEAVENGTLRKDLYFRLRVVPIHIPPLRERPEDIPPMVEHYLAHFWSRHRPDEPAPTLLSSAMDALRAYAWPGNVRELRNVVEHAVVMMDPGAPVGAEGFTLGEPMVDGMGGGSLALDPSIFQMDYHSAREEMLARFEEQYLSQILRRANGNISGAARIAGVDRTTLYRLMEKRNLSKTELLET